MSVLFWWSRTKIYVKSYFLPQAGTCLAAILFFPLTLAVISSYTDIFQKCRSINGWVAFRGKWGTVVKLLSILSSTWKLYCYSFREPCGFERLPKIMASIAFSPKRRNSKRTKFIPRTSLKTLNEQKICILRKFFNWHWNQSDGEFVRSFVASCRKAQH